MTLEEIMSVANGLEVVGNTRMDWLTAVETRLFDQKMQTALQPTEKPVKDVMVGSRFGFRIDPFTGEKAMHTGLDFPAEVGTPILAAAGGVVVVQEYHAAYGNMVEIDHGRRAVVVNLADVRKLQVVGQVVRPCFRGVFCWGWAGAKAPTRFSKIKQTGIRPTSGSKGHTHRATGASKPRSPHGSRASRRRADRLP